jgi:hypothetical protein
VRGPWAYKGATSRHAEETGRRLSVLLTDTLRLVRSGACCQRRDAAGEITEARRAAEAGRTTLRHVLADPQARFQGPDAYGLVVPDVKPDTDR